MGRSGEVPRGGVGGPLADDAGCTVLHVDMDAFYASVEIRRRPELAGRPVIVGGVGNRGVVCSANYPAREYGVRSAMPMSRARRLCPQAVVLPAEMSTYAQVSRGVMEIFRSITPLVEPRSLDEAFLDVAGAVRLFGRPARIGALIRERVAAEHGITCSVGVAPSKFLAKLSSARCKPDGMLVVPADGVLEFLHPLPIGALWGVGERTAEQLRRLGLRTVGEVAELPRGTLQHALGPAVGAHLHDLAWGRDDGRVSPDEADKSIGAEETFDVDVADLGVLHRELLRLSDKVAARLRAGGQLARTVSIKVRFADFTTVTRARTLPSPTDAGQQLYQTARQLYQALGVDGALIRLIGVRVEGLLAAGAATLQPQLGDRERGWRDADQAVDRAVNRFGAGAVRPAALVHGARAGQQESVPRNDLLRPASD
jgi:DNA polymerase IV